MDRIIDWIFGLAWWAALIVLGVCFVAFAELGLRLGRVAARRQRRREGGGQLGTVLGGLLGLLGLLLGFSFGIVESRYSDRKALVLDEANAIGTTYLRAGLLPGERPGNIRALLREYVDLRLRPTTPAGLRVAIERSGEIHGELWHQAELAGEAQPSSVLVGQFIASLNEMIDLHTSRVSVNLHQRLPDAIFNVLVTVSVLALFMLGYASAQGRDRELVAVAVLGLTIASVMVMIRELDAPGGPLFRIDQWAMQDVRRTMNGQ